MYAADEKRGNALARTVLDLHWLPRAMHLHLACFRPPTQRRIIGQTRADIYASVNVRHEMLFARYAQIQIRWIREREIIVK